jgi:hypothetical protein
MSESLQLRDPLYKLNVRFSNGEQIQFISSEAIDPRGITPETRYAVISSFSVENPSDCTDIAVLSLRDISCIRTEKVTREQLTAERRMAGIRTVGAHDHDEKPVKSLAQLKFI